MEIKDLKSNKRVLETLKEFNLKLDEITIFKKYSKEWREIQTGTSSKIVIYIDKNNIGIMKAL